MNSRPADNARDAAVVYHLDEADAAVVRELRAIVADGTAAIDDPPHLTLLYLGRLAPADLPAAAEALEPLTWPRLSTRVTGIGAFTSPGRVVAHLRIERTATMVAAHDRARGACTGEPWFAPGPWIGESWQPHVTLAVRDSTFDPADARLRPVIGRILRLRRAALVADDDHPRIIRELAMETE